MSTSEFLEFLFSDFCVFAGFVVILMIITEFLLKIARQLFLCWNRFLRHLNIRKQGWPPVHLDADGDWKRPTSRLDADE